MSNGNSNNGNGNGKLSKAELQQQQQQMTNNVASADFPDIEFGIGVNGLSVTCPKLLKTTRFLPWDIRGPFAHNEVVECSYVIEADALIIFSSRFKKAKNVKFDIPLVLRKHGNLRVSGKLLRRPDGLDTAVNDATKEKEHQ